MGLGKMGERVARALTVFDFKVNGWSRSPREMQGIRCFSGMENLDAFLSETRILVNLLPLHDETRDIINARTLSLLQPGAYVINVGRGGHVVDADLVAQIEWPCQRCHARRVPRRAPARESSVLEPAPDHPHPHTSARTLAADSIAQIVGKVAAMSRGEPVRSCRSEKGY